MPSRSSSSFASLLRRRPYVCSDCNARINHLAIPPYSQPRAQRRNFSRPSFAPKPNLDIKHITKNPGLYAQNCADRNYKHLSEHPWRILELSQRRAQLRAATVDLRQRNAANRREIERLRTASGGSSTGANVEDLHSQAKSMKEELVGIDQELDTIERDMFDLAITLPNLSSTHTPHGSTETVLDEYAGGATMNTSNKSHIDIGLELGILNFAAAASVSGWGWYYLTGAGALLEQALVQFAIAKLFSRGWHVVSPPSIIYSHIAAACGFQPRDQHGEQQIYSIASKTSEADDDNSSNKPSHCLAGTAEIPLAGMHANTTFKASQLPLKAVAMSRSYRAEAGARGVDTKGLYRVHEFTKVEMFAWTPPDDFGDETFNDPAAVAGATASQAVFDEMISVQREILQQLGLRHRVLEMPATDLGASASRKIDIEAWFPSRSPSWGEVTSCSTCGDYQSRRLATKVKGKNGSGFAYTANGTALAVPRIIAALLEAGWDEQRRVVTVPECLHSYMHGIREITVPK